MKMVIVVAITLSTLLLLAVATTVTNTAASASSGLNPLPPFKVFAKEKQGTIILMVKNSFKKTEISEVRITLLDGTIDDAKVQGWTISKESENHITAVSARNSAIQPNGRELFFVKTSNSNSIISVMAKDWQGRIVGTDDARAVIKQKVETPEGASLFTLSTSLTVTTDKIFYRSGENMVISGVLEPNEKITITIYTPSGQKLKMAGKTDPSGSFRALHVLRNAENGTYTLTVSEPSALVETTFKVVAT